MSEPTPSSAPPPARAADRAWQTVGERAEPSVVVVLIGNVALALLKAYYGWRGGSYALTADALNNLTDVAMSVGLLAGIALARRPPDDDHPYGHGKIETELARMIAIGVLLTSGAIAMGAWKRIGSPHPTPESAVLWVAAVGIVVKEFMYRIQRRAAIRSGSPALEADALNHRADVGATFAVLIGAGAIRLGGENWAVADDLAAFVVAGIMAYGSASFLWAASHEMLDARVPQELEDTVRRIVRSMRDEHVRGVEKFIGRKMGVYYVLDLHLHVTWDVTVYEGHRLAHRVKEAILREMPSVSDVLVHVEPHPGVVPVVEPSKDGKRGQSL
ncbi:MAG: cation diffusion facilitator family transporter [Candidatus Poribacteria bacterium]|nr:cation diffusion facilitator family transporter [Candidatus Poribacteria bacterium]